MTVEEMLKAAINDERAIFGAKESVKYAEDLLRQILLKI